MRIPARLVPHTITIKPYLGEGRDGPIHGPSQIWTRVYVEDKTAVLKGADGAEKTSRGFIVTDPERDIPELSLVTVWAGTPREREAQVLATDFASMPRMPSNITAYLT